MHRKRKERGGMVFCTLSSVRAFSHTETLPSKTLQIYLSFHSVVVITSALHAEGRRFEPGWKQVFVLLFIHIPQENEISK